jgi:oligopeptide/dipeptide ABC transporter ATP-binding protein
MEEARANDLYCEALHPYTKLLFSSAAGNDNKLEMRNEKFGKSSPNSSLSSCSFAPRCPNATEECLREHPALKEISPGHSIRCFNY